MNWFVQLDQSGLSGFYLGNVLTDSRHIKVLAIEFFFYLLDR